MVFVFEPGISDFVIRASFVIPSFVIQSSGNFYGSLRFILFNSEQLLIHAALIESL